MSCILKASHNDIYPLLKSVCKWLAILTPPYYGGAAAAVKDASVDCTEMFYNPTRKHTNNGMLSPIDYEAREHKLNEAKRLGN